MPEADRPGSGVAVLDVDEYEREVFAMSLPLSSDPRDRVMLVLARLWREWRGYILFFCLVWVPLRSAVIDYNPVPTGSMNPTILEGDVVWVNKLAYGLRVPLTQFHLVQWANPQRGDIVVVLS